MLHELSFCCDALVVMLSALSSVAVRCNPLRSTLQHPCARACNPMRSRLQPHARSGRHLAALACGQVSLDCNEPDEVVFTCQKCAARHGSSQQREAHGEQGYRQAGGQSASQQSGYLQEEYARQAPPQQAVPQLPYPWVQMADQDGAVYYSNPLTGEAQWEAPLFTPQPGQGVDDYRQYPYPQQGGY